MKKFKKTLSSIIVFVFVILYTFLSGDLEETTIETNKNCVLITKNTENNNIIIANCLVNFYI